MTSNYFMMNRRKPHYKRKYERLPKMTKCLGVNSIPVRVTRSRSRKCLFKGISEILFYPVLGFVRYLSAITEVPLMRASMRAFGNFLTASCSTPKSSGHSYLRTLFLLPIFLLQEAESEVHCAGNTSLRVLEHMRIRVERCPRIAMP